MEELTTKPKRFYASRFKYVGKRKDFAKNASSLLNLVLHHGYSPKAAGDKLGLSDKTISNILKDDVVINEVERNFGRLRLEAISNINAKIRSSDEKTSLYASKLMLESLDRAREKDKEIKAPSISINNLVVSLSNNPLAAAMLGKVTDNMNYRSLPDSSNVDGNQDVSSVTDTSMGRAVSKLEDSSGTEYLDYEQLQVPDDDD